MSVEGQTGVTGTEADETVVDKVAIFFFLRSFEYHNIGSILPTSDLYFS